MNPKSSGTQGPSTFDVLQQDLSPPDATKEGFVGLVRKHLPGDAGLSRNQAWQATKNRSIPKLTILFDLGCGLGSKKDTKMTTW
jgi:hypothetical protein